jgi:hypothetical protein
MPGFLYVASRGRAKSLELESRNADEFAKNPAGE